MSFCLVGRGAILLATLFVRAGATESLPWLCDERGGCWPQTWIIGGMKCGSTSFFYWLHNNRRVCAAAVVEHVSSNSKETNFWTRNSTRNSDGAAFPTLYPAARRGECAGGFVEATPTNMRVPATPGALANALPAAFRGALRFVDPEEVETGLDNQRVQLLLHVRLPACADGRGDEGGKNASLRLQLRDA